jgi:hypothetical protein
MDPDDIRAYANRDRSELQRLKRQHGADLIRDGGTDAAFRAVWALYLHAQAMHPGWPDERQRAEDLEHHIRLKKLLDRASRSLAGR